MICIDCYHSLKREYLKEDEECFCLLDGASCGSRLMKCNRYEKPMPDVFIKEVPRETVVDKVVNVVPIKKKGRPFGWRKIDKEKR
jgi:hypothetical protein